MDKIKFDEKQTMFLKIYKKTMINAINNVLEKKWFAESDREINGNCRICEKCSNLTYKKGWTDLYCNYCIGPGFCWHASSLIYFKQE